MITLRVVLSGLLLCVSSVVWCGDKASLSQSEQSATQLLSDGIRHIQSGRTEKANESFDKVIAIYQKEFKDEKTKFYCARSQPETLAYLVEAATEKKNARVVSANWAYAYYYKAYALIDLGRASDAKVMLQNALALSPSNSQFLSELGHIYQLEKNWAKALEIFKRAEDAVAMSPEEDKNSDLARAWRGMGYSYVEQGKFDDAEKMYLQCVKIDNSDRKAADELNYVRTLKRDRGML